MVSLFRDILCAGYHEYRVLSENKEDTLWRLEFIKAIKQVLEIILSLLGVTAPERM